MITQSAYSGEKMISVADIVRCLAIGLLFMATQPVVATTGDATDQLSQKLLFAEPLTWVGEQRPVPADSSELLGDIGVFETNGVNAGFETLEQFLKAHPHSAWSPSLEANMAEYYRLHGRYSLALQHWQAVWNETRDSQDAATQKIAVRAVAGWTRLLASLGKKDQLKKLFAELNARQLRLGIYATKINETKEGLALMERNPGLSYRCGSAALGHMAKALGLDPKIWLELFQVDSPNGGFHLSELMQLARSNGLAVAAVRMPPGADLVVPCVVHWKLNHYAAITEKQGDLYRVEDPTFEGDVWLDAATIAAETGGEFILPKDKVPASWLQLSSAECALVYGKGAPNIEDDSQDYGPDDGDCGDGDAKNSDCDPPASNDGAGGGGDPIPPPPPCPCGMPDWSVSEPYITLWLKDTPLLYRQSAGNFMRLTLFYKSRGDAQNGTMGGFGDKWSCNWLGHLQSQTTNAMRMMNNRVEGGQEPFPTNGLPSYQSMRRLMYLDVSGYPLPAIVSQRNAYNLYGLAVGSLTGNTNHFLTRRVDQYGRPLHQFNYQTVGYLTRITNVFDLDGRTNTLTYGNGSFPYLITAVTDPYNQTAYFNYDGNGLLTNIVDAQGMSTTFSYDGDENITNMITPYGTNSFQYFSNTNNVSTNLTRSLLVTEPNGDHQLYAYCDEAPMDFVTVGTDTYPHLRNSFHWNRLQCQLVNPSVLTNALDISVDDLKKASIKHWLHGDVAEAPQTVSDTLNAMGGPVNPVTGGRQNVLNYHYVGEYDKNRSNGSSNALKAVTSIGTLFGTLMEFGRNSLGRPTSYIYYNYYSDREWPVSTATYSNHFDASGTILQYETGPNGELTRGYGYDPVITNLLVSVTNAVNDVLRYTHQSGTLKVTSITFPSGLVRTNIYYASGPNQGFLQQQIDIGFSTNSFVYTNGNLWMKTNELGLVTTYAYDNLNRLVSTAFPDGTTLSNVYNNLDIVATKDRLNQWSYFGYNSVRQLTAETNVNGQVTTYDYCGCGAPDQIIRWNGSTPVTTTYSYDIGGRLTNILYSDGYQLNYNYDYFSRLWSVTDGTTNQLTLWHFYHGLAEQVFRAKIGAVSEGSPGQLFELEMDEYGRTTNSVDRNGVKTAQSYDYLDRMVTRQIWNYTTPNGVESFTYNARGLTNYTDQLGYLTTYVRDAAHRVLYQTNANLEVQQFTYNPADELQTLVDGKNQTNTWAYDAYGRVTNKLDALGTNIFRYQYDANDRLTNRWSVAKGNTIYKYDPIGNLTNVVYPTSSSIVLRYDPLNRLTNMVDGIGSTLFGWTDGDQLSSENGPWSNDTISYTYNYARQRSFLSLSQPNASPWVQSYGYDSEMRLLSIISPAGEFDNQYWTQGSDEVNDRRIPSRGNNSHVYSWFDDPGRMTGTRLNSFTYSPASQIEYSYDTASQVTQQVFTAGNFINYAYDKIGQLKTAQGFESDGTTPRLHEKVGYAYDAAWNLSQRTNNYLVQTFGVNKLNELTNATRTGTYTVAGDSTERKGGYSSWGDPVGVTNVTVSGTGLSSGPADIYLDGSWARTNATLADGVNSYTAVASDTYSRSDTSSVSVNFPSTRTYTYDLNGNLLSDGLRYFAYDDENELTSVWMTNAWRTDFAYDGMLRKRITKEYTWQSSSWLKTNEVRFVYDGMLVMQERDANNLPLVTYTRGNDLSGSLQDAGGISGLLARTDNGQFVSGDPNANAYYFSDRNGNVMALINTNGVIVAQYNYDPFGNILTMSGPLANANTYRFSSKEWNDKAGIYYYGYRFYDPNLQRWLNSDPIGELGGINLYGFVGNDPLNGVDALGLWNTCGHNSLLNSAFGKNESLQNDVKQWKDASKDMDDRKKGGQNPENSYQHGMRAPDQDPSDARADADKFIADRLQKAIDAERQGYHTKAMDELGRGMHTIADRSSPAHKGEQKWHGLKNPLFWPQAGIHALRELWPNRWQRQEVVDNLHDYYQQFQDGCNGGDL
jgi:RHS repeat-associated protein